MFYPLAACPAERRKHSVGKVCHWGTGPKPTKRWFIASAHRQCITECRLRPARLSPPGLKSGALSREVR